MMSDKEWIESLTRVDRELWEAKTIGGAKSNNYKSLLAEQKALKEEYRLWKIGNIRSNIRNGGPLPSLAEIEALQEPFLRTEVDAEATRRVRKPIQNVVDPKKWINPTVYVGDQAVKPMIWPNFELTIDQLEEDRKFLKELIQQASEAEKDMGLPNLPREFFLALDKVPYSDREQELLRVVDELKRTIEQKAYDKTLVASLNARENQLKQQIQNLERQIQGEDGLKKVVMALETKLKEQNDTLTALSQPPFARATVVKVRTKGNYALISAQGNIMEVSLPPEIAKNIKPGIQLRVNIKTGAVVDIVEGEPSGHIVNVIRILDGESIEVEFGGGPRAVSCSCVPGPTKGDRVMVNDGVHVVLKCLGKLQDTYSVEEAVNVPWEAIGGQKQAKIEMIEAIEGPVKHAEIFKAYGKQPIKGILLYGPPGCGKTMLAKAAATSLANLYGAKSSSGFIYVKGPEILNKYVGESEGTIRNLFKRAREHKRQFGYPAVLFIDEADAILSARGEYNFGMERTVVPMFLAEMDGMDKDNPLVLLATNRSDQLDPAVIRDGRVDRKIEVQRPGLEDAADIFKMYLKEKPIAEFCTLEEFSQIFAMKLFASEELRKRVSGSLIAGVVDQAISSAMRRDINESQGKITGLSENDIDNAVKASELANKHVQR